MSSWKLKIWAKQFVCIDFGMLWNIHFVHSALSEDDFEVEILQFHNYIFVSVY